MRTIFRKRNPDDQALITDAGSSEKVMCVAFDYAKESHTTVICDATGRKLHDTFDVENNKKGLDYLLSTIARLCRKHHIQRKHVFFGGEDCGSFAANFIDALVTRGFLVIGINAKKAQDERENSRASTDLIDTVGVAGMMIKMRGRTIHATQGWHSVIKRLFRLRLALIKAHTVSANRIHSLVDELFPGFLNLKKAGITPFSRASMWLMKERFSAAQVKARQTPSLTRKFRSFNVQDPEGAAQKIKSLADNVLPPPTALIPPLQPCLSEELITYSQIDQRQPRFSLSRGLSLMTL
jgi:hypothetical protein